MSQRKHDSSEFPFLGRSLIRTAMNFPLKQIEQYLPDPLIVAGERLTQAEQVRNLMEAEKHLWIATIERNEVEIQISPSRVRAVSCDCAFYQEEGLCEHIAAGLLVLRRKKQQEEAAREAKKRAKKAPTKLTTASILSYISPEELEDFVRDYARSNRAFSLLLRARFAKDVPLADGQNAYAVVIEAAVADARRRDGSIRYKGVLKLVRLLKELTEQTGEQYARGNFGEVHRLVSAIWEGVAPTARRAGKNSERIEVFLEENLKTYRRLLEKDLSPELQAAIFETALHTLRRPASKNLGLDHYWFDLLFALADDPERHAPLLESIDDLIRNYQHRRTFLLGLKMDLLGHVGRGDEAIHIATQYAHQPQLIARAALQEINRGNFGRAEELLRESFSRTSEQANLPLQRAQAELFRAQKREEEAFGQSRVIFLRTKTMEDFEQLRTTLPPARWEEELPLIVEQIREYGHVQRATLEAIFAREEMYDQLARQLFEAGDPTRLERFAPELFEKAPKVARLLYEEVLTKYLKEHFGKAAGEMVRQSFTFLRRIGQGGFVEKLRARLQRAFPGRKRIF